MNTEVSVYIIRDIDSRLSERGANAVKAWLASKYMFHTMHDHPGHCGRKMQAGMWGGRQRLDVLREAFQSSKDDFWNDVTQLETYAWPVIRQSVLRHASFCQEERTVHFPTVRQGLDFVGSVYINGKTRTSDDMKLQAALKNENKKLNKIQ